MSLKRLSLLALTMLLVGCGKNGARSALEKADEAFAADDVARARTLYAEAADKGNADAHFALAYRFSLPAKDALYHFEAAARQGHEQALEYTLDMLLFRANSLTGADPQRALNLYRAAKRANPAMITFVGDDFLEKCADGAGFDAEAFMRQYGIEDRPNDAYSVWELAEEASRGGRFGDPDPELVFNLVVRGGLVPVELTLAVEDAHRNWQAGVVETFEIRNYVTSGLGMGYCAGRAMEEDLIARQEVVDELEAALDTGLGSLLREACKAADTFIDLKVSGEELHGGSGRFAWMSSSAMEQKNDYLALIAKIVDGFVPSASSASLSQAEEALSKTYGEVEDRIVEYRSQYKGSEFATVEGVLAVDRLWRVHREASANLFSRIGVQNDATVWKIWLTDLRSEQLLATFQRF